jgi:hypothetical protein
VPCHERQDGLHFEPGSPVMVESCCLLVAPRPCQLCLNIANFGLEMVEYADGVRERLGRAALKDLAPALYVIIDDKDERSVCSLAGLTAGEALGCPVMTASHR